MIDKGIAQREIDTGLSAVCAWCTHWHEGVDRSGRISMCGQTGCGGPGSGMGFPLYDGPMKSRLASMCFICGGEADAGVQMKGNMIGVCNKLGPEGKTHMDRFRQMMSGPGKKIVIKEVVVPVIEGN